MTQHIVSRDIVYVYMYLFVFFPSSLNFFSSCFSVSLIIGKLKTEK